MFKEEADKFESGAPKRWELSILGARLAPRLALCLFRRWARGSILSASFAEGEHSGQGGRDGEGMCLAAATGKEECQRRAQKVGYS